jgi:uncharacterized membrane protein
VVESLKQVIEATGVVMEAAGVSVIVLGAAVASVAYLVRLKNLGATQAYATYRVGLARSILLGLELLVAGDIIRTVVVAPTLENEFLEACVETTRPRRERRAVECWRRKQPLQKRASDRAPDEFMPAGASMTPLEGRRGFLKARMVF